MHELGHELFDVTVAGDDLERTKPFPDPYLHAAAGGHRRRPAALRRARGLAHRVHCRPRVGRARGRRPARSCRSSRPEGMHVVTSLTELTPEILGEWSYAWSPR
ncbi:MAG: hypothetical protein U0R68_03885 [Candidatus Nanopelagicales bacterium]